MVRIEDIWGQIDKTTVDLNLVPRTADAIAKTHALKQIYVADHTVVSEDPAAFHREILFVLKESSRIPAVGLRGVMATNGDVPLNLILARNLSSDGLALANKSKLTQTPDADEELINNRVRPTWWQDNYPPQVQDLMPDHNDLQPTTKAIFLSNGYEGRNPIPLKDSESAEMAITTYLSILSITLAQE